MVSASATVALARSTERRRKSAFGEATLTMYGACRTSGPSPSARHRRPNSRATSARTDGGAHARGFEPQICAASAPHARAESMAPNKLPRVGTCAPMRTRPPLRLSDKDLDGLTLLHGRSGIGVLEDHGVRRVSEGEFVDPDDEPQVLEEAHGLLLRHSHHVGHGEGLGPLG